MTEVLITAPCSDEIKLRLEEFKNSCVFLFKDRKSDIGSAEVVIGEPRTERIRAVSYTHLTLPTICSV